MRLKDCTPGVEARVSGTALHHGHVVRIVDARGELVRAREQARQSGAQLSEGPISRGGLVPAFDPAYPTTLWWWFAPHQLEVLS